MRELIEAITSLGPRLAADLVGILSGPKRFFATPGMEEDRALVDSLIFLVICEGVSFVLSIPLLKSPIDQWAACLISISLSVISGIVAAVASMISFRIVGGGATVRQHMVIIFYAVGITSIILNIYALAIVGTVREVWPSEAEQALDWLASAPISGRVFWESNASLFVYMSGLVAVAGIALWIYTCWGALRKINSVTKLRSALAWLIFWPLYLIYSVVSVQVDKALDLRV